MRVEVITHKSGEQLPILLDQDGLPIPGPNEYVFSRRGLATKTLEENLRALLVLYRWLQRHGINLENEFKQLKDSLKLKLEVLWLSILDVTKPKRINQENCSVP
jgi:hypothetical protein